MDQKSRNPEWPAKCPEGVSASKGKDKIFKKHKMDNKNFEGQT